MDSAKFNTDIEIFIQDANNVVGGYLDVVTTHLLSTKANIKHIKSIEKEVNGVMQYIDRKKLTFRYTQKCDLIDSDCIVKIANRHYYQVIDIDTDDRFLITLYVERSDV